MSQGMCVPPRGRLSDVSRPICPGDTFENTRNLRRDPDALLGKPAAAQKAIAVTSRTRLPARVADSAQSAGDVIDQSVGRSEPRGVSEEVDSSQVAGCRHRVSRVG